MSSKRPAALAMTAALLSLTACGIYAKLDESMHEGDWSFEAARVPATAEGSACVATCQDVYDSCQEIHDRSTAYADECNSKGFNCYTQCPGGTKHVAAGNGQPGPFRDRACREGVTGPSHCMHIAGITAGFIDP